MEGCCSLHPFFIGQGELPTQDTRRWPMLLRVALFAFFTPKHHQPSPCHPSPPYSRRLQSSALPSGLRPVSSWSRLTLKARPRHFRHKIHSDIHTFPLPPAFPFIHGPSGSHSALTNISISCIVNKIYALMLDSRPRHMQNASSVS
jgi:hypothetical protein